ncbi:hypothetical protein V7021_24880, partial [Cytobacillus firmus]
NKNLFLYISQEERVNSLLLSLVILHSSIYFFILIYGSPEENETQKFEKLRRKFILWLISMIITIGYIAISIFKGYTTLHPFYFIFILLVAMERTITNYKALTKFLDEQGFYEECLRGFKGEYYPQRIDQNIALQRCPSRRRLNHARLLLTRQCRRKRKRLVNKRYMK